jgi:hypothetical protein
MDTRDNGSTGFDDDDEFLGRVDQALARHPDVPQPDGISGSLLHASAIEELVKDIDETIHADTKRFLRWGVEEKECGINRLTINLDGDTGFILDGTPEIMFSKEDYAALHAVRDRFLAAEQARQDRYFDASRRETVDAGSDATD